MSMSCQEEGVEMIFVGVDGGLSGGIIVLDNDGNIIKKIVMPVIKGKESKTQYDIQAIKNILVALKNSNADTIVAGLEKAQVSHIGGKSSMFSKGFCYGMFQGLLTATEISYQIFRPQDWQKQVLAGIPGTDTKQRSIMWCKMKYPAEDWRATQRSINDHDGLCDACCIANYVRAKNGQQL